MVFCRWRNWLLEGYCNIYQVIWLGNYGGGKALVHYHSVTLLPVLWTSRQRVLPSWGLIFSEADPWHQHSCTFPHSTPRPFKSLTFHFHIHLLFKSALLHLFAPVHPPTWAHFFPLPHPSVTKLCHLWQQPSHLSYFPIPPNLSLSPPFYGLLRPQLTWLKINSSDFTNFMSQFLATLSPHSWVSYFNMATSHFRFTDSLPMWNRGSLLLLFMMLLATNRIHLDLHKRKWTQITLAIFS